MPAERDHEGAPVQKVTKELHERGSGVSLHFDASFAAEYHLDPETEVVVEVVEDDGDVSFQIGGIPAGFTYEDLVEFADNRGWSISDEFVDEDRNEWFLTYRTATGAVAVEIDSESQIDGNVVNNVTIRSDPVDVTGDFKTYGTLCAAAQRTGTRVSIEDSVGAWERLRSAPESDADDAPDRETFEQLSDVADTVTVQLVDHRSSLNTTLEEIGKTADGIEEAIGQLL
jgi:hypothetical protein